ncbi:hypothetical protein NDN08_001237 [Rhodosorus marinus]|uniref:Uncharacterized protein n=1 Tax=Rhodosorus marinus TaxID=101924 RepID=A0AAV8URQ8_9RHOD|nr:hypothetical protein NDN08_001237 [Rhodosorus marinus]
MDPMLGFVGSGLALGLGRGRCGNMSDRRKGATISMNEGGKLVTYGDQARLKLVAGIDAVADAVKVTLGPRGRNVVLYREFGVPQVVNDGVTIAKDIDLADLEKNVGVNLVQQVASRTDIIAGDGTTSSTVLCQAMVKEGVRGINAGRNPVIMKRGIDFASKALIKEIMRLSRRITGIEDIRSVATISAGNDERLGNIIATAFEKAGPTGSTIVEESQGIEDEVWFTEGMEFERGYITPYFVTDQQMQTAVLEKPRVLITDRKISSITDIVKALEAVSKSKEPLLIIAEDVSAQALSTLVVNKMRGTLQCVAVKCPGFGEQRKAYLQDIASLTGAEFINSELGMDVEDFSIEQLGIADRVIVEKEQTTLIAAAENQAGIQQRIKAVQAEMAAGGSTFQYEQLQQRLARLSGGISRIKVGAATETELKDKKLRYEDALNSTKAAIELGVVPGGGTTILHAAKVLTAIHDALTDEDEQYGVLIVKRAMKAPVKQIALNAGVESEVVLNEVQKLEFGMGYNAKSDEYTNLFEDGVVDPTKVVCWGIEHASSIAGMVLTTECMVTELPEEEVEEEEFDDAPSYNPYW